MNVNIKLKCSIARTKLIMNPCIDRWLLCIHGFVIFFRRGANILIDFIPRNRIIFYLNKICSAFRPGKRSIQLCVYRYITNKMVSTQLGLSHSGEIRQLTYMYLLSMQVVKHQKFRKKYYYIQHKDFMVLVHYFVHCQGMVTVSLRISQNYDGAS